MDIEDSQEKRSSKFYFSIQQPQQVRRLKQLKEDFKSIIIFNQFIIEIVQIEQIITPKQVDMIQENQLQSSLRMVEKFGLNLKIKDLKNIYFNLDKYYAMYEENEVLGEGCIGLVKSIRRITDSSIFAVKIVKTTDEEIVKNVQLIYNNSNIQMIHEFCHLSKLSHPNIVHMYEIYIDWREGFQQTGQVNIIMEKINGIEMFEVIHNLGHYTETDARLIFHQILEAIKFLHSNYICHRDLKPNNILCSLDCQQVKITDFNVSKFSDKYKEFGNLQGKIEMWTYTGTVAFSAPEIFSGNPYNEAIDMWSAGCILFTMLSGQLPFNSDWLNDLIDKILRGEYEMSSQVWENISSEAKDLISRLLQVNPAQRITVEQALSHQWIAQQQSSKITIKRDNLKKNIKRLTKKHLSFPGNQVKRLRTLCYLFGAGELWRRNSAMGKEEYFIFSLIFQRLLLEDFRKVRSFDVSTFQTKSQKVKVVQTSKENTYEIQGLDSDEDFNQ